MDNEMTTVWFPHIIDAVTGRIWGLGYFANRYDAQDRAWEYEDSARRRGYNDVSVKIITREVPAAEARFWISTNRF